MTIFALVSEGTAVQGQTWGLEKKEHWVYLWQDAELWSKAVSAILLWNPHSRSVWSQGLAAPSCHTLPLRFLLPQEDKLSPAAFGYPRFLVHQRLERKNGGDTQIRPVGRAKMRTRNFPLKLHFMLLGRWSLFSLDGILQYGALI